MASFYWIKLYDEILDDPKMGRLSDGAFRLCINLFLLAGRQDERDGRLPSLDDIAWILRLRTEDITALWEELERAGVVCTKDESPFVVNFDKRQGAIDDAERMRRYRERKRQEKLQSSDDSVTGEKRGRYGGVTKRNADIDTDIESDTDREQEGEYPPPPYDDYANHVWGAIVKFCKGDQRRASLIVQAQSKFSEIRKCKQPYVNGSRENIRRTEREWWEPLEEMITESENSFDIFERVLRHVVDLADAPDGFTLAAPNAAVKTYKSQLAKLKRGVAYQQTNGRQTAADSYDEVFA
ncbi:MAG: hypothetical protein KC419_14420 [Anaerolineales bacterium]|nr:hypothetical protein [Anaerolineales bacterium]